MKLIRLKEAQRLIQEKVHTLVSIQVSLQEALGSVVASDMVATVDSPSVDASLKDGFAVRAADLAGVDPDGPITLALAGRSVAGGQMQPALEPGQTIGVTTGAPLPSQADAVVPVEHVEEDDGVVRFSRPVTSGQDILPKGSDVAQNQKVVLAGDTVTPGLLGLLAASGHSNVDVVCPPRVAIISTGDEVVAPGMSLPEGKLYASNLTTLDAWCRKLGFRTRCSILADSTADITRSIKSIIVWADVLITSGGAGRSERDRVAPALENLNWRQLFHGVCMRPGKGTGFGVMDDKPVFMLSGGPSANLTGFLQLALPGLQRMAGYKPKGLPEGSAVLDSKITSRHVDWTRFVFGKLKSVAHGLGFEPMNISSRLQSMARADALAVIPEGESHLPAGTPIRVQRLYF